MNKNRENFIKYSNDLYFHHLLVENERIRKKDIKTFCG